MFSIDLASVAYGGANIGDDIWLSWQVGSKSRKMKLPLKNGKTHRLPAGGQKLVSGKKVPGRIGQTLKLRVGITEVDLFKNDVGSSTWTYKIPKYSQKDLPFSETIVVCEGSSKARFTLGGNVTCLHPLFAELWSKHPANKGVRNPCSTNGNSNFENQCAIRMGLALQRAGINLNGFKGAFCWHGHGRKHVLRAQELADWLATQTQKFGTVKKFRGKNAGAFSGKLGVVFFQNFWGRGNQGDHIDMWDGKRMPPGAGNDYFTRAQEVWFWQL